MAHKLARTLFFLTLIGLGFGLVSQAAPQPSAPAPAWTSLDRTRAERVVFLGGDLSDESLITFMASVAASGHPGVPLLDLPAHSTYLKAFLTSFRPEQVVPVGTFPAGIADLERRLGVTTAPPLPVKGGRLPGLWHTLFPQAARVVVCPAQPRGQLLQAACLAGVEHAPLFITHGEAGEEAELRRWVADWRTEDILAVGTASHVCRSLHGVRVHRLADTEAVTAAYLRHQCKKGPIRSLVVANPADTGKGLGGMSMLAPWVALQHRGALLLTNDEGKNTTNLVRRALKDPRLRQAEALLLVADLEAIPMERRVNPVAGKDTHIEMEPCTPIGNEPFTFATGRLFNEDPGVVALMLARQRLLAAANGTRRKVMVASNPGGSLPLLEVFSRYTSRELRNCGYELTALFGNDVTRDEVRRRLPEQDLFLWEGHHSTLIKEFNLPAWTEPLPPSFVFLQSCLALTEAKAQPLLRRGAVGVVGSSTRTYSASGGAFSLAFFDALLYDQQSLGGSVRQAKNFLLAYSLLKEKRLGKEARLGGANLRSAWAFTLWGDPTLKLPTPAADGERLAPVRHHLRGDTLVVSLPDTGYEKIKSARYEASMQPNARMAGLLSKDGDDSRRRMVPFVFAEVHLPKAPAGRTPRLQSRLPDDHWVFCWDQRRQVGYLLMTPRPRDQREIRFHIDWETRETAEANY